MRSRRSDWYVFGAQAALIYGAARVTADVDVTVRLGKVTPTRLAATLKRHGFELRVDDPHEVPPQAARTLRTPPANLVQARPRITLSTDAVTYVGPHASHALLANCPRTSAYRCSR